MGAGKAIKRQFHPSMFKLEHESASDFYLTCWQRNRAVLPLLCIRAVIFLGCLAILIASLVLTPTIMVFGHWFLFLTHWALIVNTIASGAGFVVSLKAYMVGPMEASFELPISVKVFWVWYDIAVTLAFFVTIYYWMFLSSIEAVQLALNEVLDVFTHGINSVMMFMLVVTSRVPARILHFIYPVAFCVLYLIFSVIYHFAGGTYAFEGDYIYPMLDWNDPGPTVGMTFATAAALIVVHCIVVAIAALRDYLTRKYIRDSDNFSITNY